MNTQASVVERANGPPTAYPPQLQYIKALILQEQYQQCIRMCGDILAASDDEHVDYGDVHRTFVCFYLGLAYDQIARHMHEHSRMKIPSFSMAEEHYVKALKHISDYQRVEATRTYARNPMSTIKTSGGSTRTPQSSRSNVSKSPSSPGSALRQNHQFRSLPVASPGSDISDREDLESHDSFEDIITPTRLLRREISRMSLLERKLPRDASSVSLIEPKTKIPTSMSQSLLRPIRPGSPPTQYHLPPKSPHAGHYPRRSRIAVYTRCRGAETPTKGSRKEFTPPVSPLTVDDLRGGVNDTTVSPLSITSSRTCSDVLKDFSTQKDDARQLEQHIGAMKSQIMTHVNLVQQAKLRTTVSQAQRVVARSMPPIITLPKRTSGKHGTQNEVGTSNALQSAHSYWSFTPENLQTSNKEKMIENGRARKWKRERFQAEKYQNLAEKALAEL